MVYIVWTITRARLYTTRSADLTAQALHVLESLSRHFGSDPTDPVLYNRAQEIIKA